MRLLDIFESLDAPTPTVEDLAKKYNVDVSKVKAQLARGVKAEKEHTSNTKQATEIALDHLGEDLHYYKKLAAAGLKENQEPKKKDSNLIDALRDFLPIAIKHLKLDHIPKIKLEKHIEGTHIPTFGRFTNDSKEITVVVSNRHPVDILRTLAHEMVHYKQELLNQLDQDSWHTGSPDEDEANAEGGVIMRLFNKAHPEYLDNAPVELQEKWSQKYKRSIDCSNPKGFSQRAHCQGRKKANENFADGKNPGRKGLAKRSGVDCKKSVTALRKIAKNSSGEKQRMAHWCANMKAGRNKG